MMTIPFGHALDTVCYSLREFTSLNATTATRRPLVRIRSSDEQLPMTAEDQVAVTGTLTIGIVATAHYCGGESTGALQAHIESLPPGAQTKTHTRPSATAELAFSLEKQMVVWHTGGQSTEFCNIQVAYTPSNPSTAQHFSSAPLAAS